MSLPQSPAYSDITITEQTFNNKNNSTNNNGNSNNKQKPPTIQTPTITPSSQSQSRNTNTSSNMSINTSNYVKSHSFHSPKSPPTNNKTNNIEQIFQESHRDSVTKHQQQKQQQNHQHHSANNINATNANTFYSNNAIYVSETDLYNSKNRLIPIPSMALLSNSRYLPLFIRDRDVLRIGSHWSKSNTNISSPPPQSQSINDNKTALNVVPVYIHETDCLKIEHEPVCIYISDKDLLHVKEKFKVEFFKSTNTPTPLPYQTPPLPPTSQMQTSTNSSAHKNNSLVSFFKFLILFCKFNSKNEKNSVYAKRNGE